MAGRSLVCLRSSARLKGRWCVLAGTRSLFGGKERPRVSQSKVLSGEEGPLFTVETTRLNPEDVNEFIKISGAQMLRISESNEYPAKLVGAFSTMIGPVKDQTTHIWCHTDYNSIMETQELLNKDQEWLDYRVKRNKMVQRRSSQVLLPFTFWDTPDPEKKKEPKGLYEMRTYTLRPGTLIEWGQAWSEGIKYRRDEAVGGWFSQIGEMHQVHHLWAYNSLEDRHQTRQAAWEFPGWDECVVKTGEESHEEDHGILLENLAIVPLIRYMVVRILTPLPYSPLK